MMTTTVPSQAAVNTPTTAAQVLDGPGTADKIPSAGPSNPTAPAADDKVSPKLQVLMQREKVAIERERAAKEREAAADAKAATIAAREAKLQEFESIKTTNPRKALELLGLSYQDLTQVELADGEVSPDVKIRKVEEKFDSFLQSQEAAKRQFEEDSKKQQEERLAQATDNHRREISAYIKENPARYELISYEAEEDLVYDVIEEHYTRTLNAAVKAAEDAGEDVSDIRGEVLTIAQAADKVEAHLEKKYDKARELSKVKALMSRKTSPTEAKPTPKPTTPARHMLQTLNNNLSATPAQPRTRPMTDDERLAKAVAYARGLRP